MSKLEFGKNICQSARFEPIQPVSAELADIFSQLQLWPLISLQPLDQNQFLVLHLKDLFHICLETKAQGFWMNFKLCIMVQSNPIYYIKWGLLMLNLAPLSVGKYIMDGSSVAFPWWFRFSIILKQKFGINTFPVHLLYTPWLNCIKESMCSYTKKDKHPW